MTDDQWGLIVGAVVLLGAALAVRYVCRAAAGGTLRPNHIAGMRTTATLSSPEAWQAGHRAALGWTDRTAIACVVVLVLAVVLGITRDDVGWGLGLLTGAAGVLLIGTVGGGVTAHRAAARVRDRTRGARR